MEYIDIDSNYRNRNQFPIQAQFTVLREQNHLCDTSRCSDSIRDPVSDQMIVYPNPQETLPLAYFTETLQEPFNTITSRTNLPFMYSTSTPTVLQLDELPLASTDSSTTSFTQNSLYPRGSIPLGQANEFYTGDYLEDVTNNEYRLITELTYENIPNNVFQTGQVQSYSTSVSGETILTTDPASTTQIPTSNIDRFYQGKFLRMISGNASGSSRLIINYTATSSTQYTFRLESSFGSAVQEGDTFAIVSDRKWFATIESPFSNTPSAYPCFRAPLPTQTVWNPTILATESSPIVYIQLDKLFTPSIAVDYLVSTGEIAPSGDELGFVRHTATTDQNGSFGITPLFTQSDVYVKSGFGLKVQNKNLPITGTIESPQLLYTQPNTQEAQWQSIAWSPTLNRLVVVGRQTVSPFRDMYIVMTSTDAVNWEAAETLEIDSGASEPEFTDIVWHTANNRFVAAGPSSSFVWYTDDGFDWTRVNVSREYESLASDGTRVVAIGVDATHYGTTADGVSWNEYASGLPSAQTWTSLAYDSGNGLFVAVASSGTASQRVATGVASYPTVTWTARTAASDNDWKAVAYASSIPLLVAVSSTGTNDRVMTSANGTTWTSRSTPNNAWQSVAWSPDLTLFAAVANSGIGNRVMTSPDGIGWTSRASAADVDWTDITWAADLGLFVAVSASSTNQSVMTSTDGITWSLRTSATTNDWYLHTKYSLDLDGVKNWQENVIAPEFKSPNNALIEQQISFANLVDADGFLTAAYAYFDGASYRISLQYNDRANFGPYDQFLVTSADELRVIKLIKMGRGALDASLMSVGGLLYTNIVSGLTSFLVFNADQAFVPPISANSDTTVNASETYTNSWSSDVSLILNDAGEDVAAVAYPIYGSEVRYSVFNLDGDTIESDVVVTSLATVTRTRITQSTVNGQLVPIIVGVDETEGLFVLVASTQVGDSASDWSAPIILDSSSVMHDVQIINSYDEQPLVVYSKTADDGTNQLVSLRLTDFTIQACSQYRIRQNPPSLSGMSTTNALTEVTSSTVTLPDTLAPLQDGVYKCHYVHLYQADTRYTTSPGAQVNQFRFITAYDGSTGTITVSPPFNPVPEIPLPLGTNALELFTASLATLGDDASGNGYNFTVDASYAASYTDANGVRVVDVMSVSGGETGLSRDITGDTALLHTLDNIVGGVLTMSLAVWALSTTSNASLFNEYIIGSDNNKLQIQFDTFSVGTRNINVSITSDSTEELVMVYTNVEADVWYHIVVQLTSNGPLLYINGEDVTQSRYTVFTKGSSSFTMADGITIDDLYIGSNGPSSPIEGYITDVVFSSEVWSSSIINNILLHGLGTTNNINWDVLGGVTDQFHPIDYFGTPTLSERVCYEVELTHLTLPNVVLKTGFGDRIAFYPYVYVEFSNFNDTSSQHFYSNNPHANRVLFKVPIRDTSTPDRAKFVNNTSGMRIKSKFNPNDNFVFAVYLPNGELFETFESDTLPPSRPNFLLQLSVTIGFRRLAP